MLAVGRDRDYGRTKCTIAMINNFQFSSLSVGAEDNTGEMRAEKMVRYMRQRGKKSTRQTREKKLGNDLEKTGRDFVVD